MTMEIEPKATHSPEPWTFDRREMGCRTIRCNRPDNDPETGLENEVCVTPGLSDDEEDFSNACLICAAPQMLEALRAVQAWIGKEGSPRTHSGFIIEMQRKVNGAISVAEGDAQNVSKSPAASASPLGADKLPAEPTREGSEG